MVTKEELKYQLEVEIVKFLESEESLIEFNQISWPLLKEVLEGFGYQEDSDDCFDTNGWQIDFWVTYIKEDQQPLKISGSLWYGNIEIIKNEKA